jgi:glutaredoxin
MRWPWSWSRGSPNSPAARRPARVILYSRKGCHLCDDALVRLTEEQRRYGFALEVVEVDAVPELAARYGEWVPTVVIDGKERFRGAVNRALLVRLLRNGAPS